MIIDSQGNPLNIGDELTSSQYMPGKEKADGVVVGREGTTAQVRLYKSYFDEEDGGRVVDLTARNMKQSYWLKLGCPNRLIVENERHRSVASSPLSFGFM
jgi:hypothetical protein